MPTASDERNLEKIGHHKIPENLQANYYHYHVADTAIVGQEA